LDFHPKRSNGLLKNLFVVIARPQSGRGDPEKAKQCLGFLGIASSRFALLAMTYTVVLNGLLALPPDFTQRTNGQKA
jgi:hypothetical protein